MTEIKYWHSKRGDNPVYDFIHELPKDSITKVLRIFETIEIYGLKSIIPHIKKITGLPLWEIRIVGKNSIRLIYVARTHSSILVLHGFIKKSQKTPNKELAISMKRYRESIDS